MLSPEIYSFNPHAVPPFFTAAATLLLGLIVVIREKGSRESLLYFSYTLAVSAWMFCASIALLMVSEESAYRWMKFANAAVTMIPAALYHFTVVVLRAEGRHRRRTRLAWTVSGFFLAATLLTDALLGGFHHYSWGIFLKYRWPSFLFMAYFMATGAATLRLYWREYRASDRNATMHRRAKAFLIAFGIGYLGALDFLPAVGIPYYPMSFVPTICMLILAARAIWRYRLVDITPAFAVREIIDTMTDGLIVLDRDRIVRVVNEATCTLLGCGEQELVGRRPGESIAGCGEFAERLESTAGGDPVRNREVTCLPVNGSTALTLSISTSIMRNAAGEPIATVCLLNNVTDRRRAEEERERLIAQLREANEKLLSIDRMKSNFISMVSHELRTPLTTIKAFIELLLFKQEMPGEQKTRLMTTINIEADRLARLISDLLDLSRIEAGSMKWKISEVSVDELVQAVIESMGVLFENKNLRVTADFRPPLARLSGDRDRLVQVMTNILSNAAKFTPQGGEIRIAVRQESSPAEQIVVEVSDTGIGIPDAHLDRIFEKFHRADDELTAAVEGTGLGLAIARQIVEYHGGRISASSTRGKGSTFMFTLPLGKQAG